MTLKEAIYEQTGYECFTTFDSDFAIADMFGVEAIKDTFDRASKEWRSDIKYLTELVMIINRKARQYASSNEKYSRLYSDLYYKLDNYVLNNFKDKDIDYYLSITD